MMKKLLSMLLCLSLVLSLGAAAFAEGPRARVVLGADLTNEQVAKIYQSFGVQDGSVPELNLTNAEERRYLQHYVESSVIGTKAISCVYVELTAAGSGMEIKTSNVSWCTPEMYVSALTTAGVTDAKILVTAPFPVSGTAALAGVYKAYEDITGSEIGETEQQVSTQELAVSGELAQQIGSFDALSIISDLKMMLDETDDMSDGDLSNTIREIGRDYSVDLNDSQIGQLRELVRSLEKLNPDDIRQRVEDVRETLQKIEDAKDEVVSFAKTMYRIFGAIGDFIDNIREILGKK